MSMQVKIPNLLIPNFAKNFVGIISIKINCINVGKDIEKKIIKEKKSSSLFFLKLITNKTNMKTKVIKEK